MLDELKSLLLSKRFWAAVAGVVFLLTDAFGLPLTQDQVQGIVLMIASLILGDTIRPLVRKVQPDQGANLHLDRTAPAVEKKEGS